jgi:peptidyl-prolyl cis-trans isomerase C
MTKKRTIQFSIMFIFIFGFITGIAGAGSGAENHGLNKKIASVNGIMISSKAFKWAYDSEEQRLVTSGDYLDDDAVRNLKQTVFDKLINREILYQESQKKNIEINQSRIDDEFERIRSSMMSDIDMETIKKELDMNEKDIKAEFRRVFAIDDLMKKELDKKGPVTENEMKNFYDTHMDIFTIPVPVRVSHILIRVAEDFNDDQKKEARKKIEMIQEKLSKGEDFAALARTYSEGPSNVQGGDISYVKKGQTVKEFENAAYALKTGEISEIVETPFGYHLIKATDKKPDRFFDYEDSKSHIENFIKQERAHELELAYILKLKKDAKIEILEDPKTLSWDQ